MSRIVPALSAAVVAGVLANSKAVAAPVVHYAYGSGHIAIPREYVTFSAVEYSDGSASGFALVQDVSARVAVYIQVDCLNVITTDVRGDVAIVSGIVKRSSNPNAVRPGWVGIFEVIDNDVGAPQGNPGHDGDEGDTGPDLMSPVNFFANPTPGEVSGQFCKVPAEFDLQPVQDGDIEVH